MTNEVRDIFGVGVAGSITNQTGQTRVTWFEYDKLGRRTHRFLPAASLDDTNTNPGMEKVTYSRITNGAIVTLRKSIRDFRNITVTSDYDVMDRLATKLTPAVDEAYPQRTNTFEYTGPLLTKVTETGTNWSRTAHYAYDDSRRLKRKDTPEGVLTYAYRTDGSVGETKAFLRSAVAVNAEPSTTPSTQVGYGYDALGRLASVTNYHSGTNVTTYTYDNAGNLALTALPQHNRFTNTFDARNRLTQLAIGKDNWTLVRRYDYALSSTGLRTNVMEWNAGSGTNLVQRRRVGYLYDQPVEDWDTVVKNAPKMNRLTHEHIFDGTATSLTASNQFLYDGLGNRRIIRPEGITNLTYLAREFTIQDQPEEAGLAFDANGNTASYVTNSATVLTDSYDAQNRLVKRVEGNKTITFGYDHDGNRVWEHVATTSGGSTTHATLFFLIDAQNPTGYLQTVLESWSNSANPSPDTFYQALEWGHRLITIKTWTSTTYTFGQDGLGSTRMLLSGAGNIVAGYEYDYDAWGVQTSTTLTDVDVKYRYAGYQWSTTLGMAHMGARDYWPTMGRFWIKDSYEGSASNPMSLHKYLYCAADPVNRIDPSGNHSLANILATSAIIGSVSGGVVGGIQDGAKGALAGMVSGAVLAPAVTLATIGGGIGIAAVSGGAISTTAGIATSFALVTSGSIAWNIFELVHAKNTRERLAAGVSMAFTLGGASYGAYRIAQVPALPPRGPQGALPGSKEQVGALLSETMALLRGEIVVAREVTIETPSGIRVRVDLVTKSVSGKIKFIEAKFGPGADLTTNQKAGYPEILRSGGEIRTGKLEGQGMSLGSKLLPEEVLIDWWD